MDIHDLIRKSQDGYLLLKNELLFLLSLRPDSPETYLVMAEANRISKELTGNRAEVHAQLALNLAPCPANCRFCSFAQVNGVFQKETRITPEQAVVYARPWSVLLEGLREGENRLVSALGRLRGTSHGDIHGWRSQQWPDQMKPTATTSSGCS